MTKRQIRQENQQLEAQAQAKGFVFGIFGPLSLIERNKPQPDPLWSSIYQSVAEKQAEDFLSAFASYAIHTAAYRI